MKTEWFHSLKPGDEVEMTRGWLKGARAVVRAAANDGKGSAVRVQLPSGRTLFARQGAVRAVKG